jgi:hypothetical protein
MIDISIIVNGTGKCIVNDIVITDVGILVNAVDSTAICIDMTVAWVIMMSVLLSITLTTVSLWTLT